MQESHPLQRPESATHALTAIAGLTGFLSALFLLRWLQSLWGQGSLNIVSSALFVMGMTAASLFMVDLIGFKVHLRSSTGLDFSNNPPQPSWSRSLLKFAGLLGSLGFIGFLYWLLPEYHAPFYDRYYTLLRLILPAWILLALPYIYFIDRHQRQPRDGYWNMGKLVTLDWQAIDRSILGQHLLGWLVKGFFLPLMFTYLCNDLSRFLTNDFSQLTSFQFWFDFLHDFFYFIDVGLVSMGYLMSLRLTDTHLRSSEPTMLGWTVALVCYEPFWSLIGRQYLAYDTDVKWGAWLWNMPILYGIWGGVILILTAIYVWATIIFGARFSNLTHRGIITNGPYRYTKHPAYVAKNLSWWMVSIPFMASGTPDVALRHCLLLLGLNLIYAMRAKTEEWHLSRDPDYVAYALWMEQNGLFRFIRYLPLVKYLVYRQSSATSSVSNIKESSL